ncbi:MAG: hypothetical protein M2R46_02681 [Verrucomicrobia subdivision 3 bacterium]|nr:hypothetical protein [Limisphaerales bacterium]
MPTAGPALLGLSNALGRRGKPEALGRASSILSRQSFNVPVAPRSNARLRCGQGLSLRLVLKRISLFSTASQRALHCPAAASQRQRVALPNSGSTAAGH